MKDIYFSNYNAQNQDDDIDIYSDSSMLENSEQTKKSKSSKSNKHKKHKLSGFLIKAIISIFVIVSLFIMFVSAISGYKKVDLAENSYVSSLSLKSSPLVSNILLIGCDAASGQSQRSDSMILVSIDFVHMKIKMTSFLRDSYVYIPFRNKSDKINSAYSHGGAQGLVDTLEYNFGVNIDHYVSVDFEMFTKIIDTLGGIDIEVTDKEAKFINRTTRYTVESGENVHLGGNEALVYARIRKLDSDYMRTQRQRKVISAIISKCKKMGIAETLKIISNVFPLIETDMNSLEITALSYKGGISLLGFDIEELRIPADDMMSTGYVGDMWVEKPDIDKCKESLIDFIYR